MRRYRTRVPEQLIGGVADLKDLLISLGRIYDIPKWELVRAVDLIPQEIADSFCFLETKTHIWRYEFGQPFDRLPQNKIVIGTHMFCDVTHLLKVMLFIADRLSSAEQPKYLGRLKLPEKHSETLMECAPILRLIQKARVQYEPAGWAAGNKTIDWVIEIPNEITILLEAKSRSMDLVEFFKTMNTSSDDLNNPPPKHDTSLLFRGLEQKFKPKIPGKIINAAWIGIGLRQERKEIQSAFYCLDSNRIDLAIFGDWHDDVWVCTYDILAKVKVLEVLGLHESTRLLFDRNE